MPELETPQNLSALGPEPELHLLLSNQTLDEPLWKSLFRNVDDFFFPKKLPPLVLTSKPVPVRDIWGFYNYKGRGAAGSTVIHVLALAAHHRGYLPGPENHRGRQAKRNRRVDCARRHSRSTAFEDHERRRRRWWRSRQTAGIAGTFAQAVHAADHSAAGRGAQPESEAAKLPRPSWFLPIFTCSSRICPTWAIRFRVCRRCPRMELAMAAELAPVVVAASVRDEGPGYGPGSGGGTGGGVFHVGGGVSAPKQDLCSRSGVFRGSPQGEISRDVRSVRGRGAGWQAARHPRVSHPGLGTGREGD